MSPLSTGERHSQDADWENRKYGASLGNPYATLCSHCMGRHAPPFDNLCPNESINDLRARLAAEKARTASSVGMEAEGRNAPKTDPLRAAANTARESDQ